MGTIFKREHKYKNAAGETVSREGKTYWIQYYKNGRPYRESTKSTSHDHARKLLAQREGQIVENRFHGLASNKTTYDDLEKDMLDDYQINGKKSARRLTSLFNNLQGKFKGMKAADITSDMITEYIKARQKQKAKNGTINREISALRRMFNLGARKTPPKVTQVPYFSMLKEALPREGFFEYGEYVKLLEALPDYVKPIFTVGYYTGMRKGEILKIKWDQVDLEAGKVTLSAKTTKTSQQRIVYLA
jgi:integrase